MNRPTLLLSALFLALASGAPAQIPASTSPALTEQARLYARCDNWQGVLDNLTFATATGNDPELLLQAQALCGSARYTQAAAAFEQWLSENPASPSRGTAHMALAEILLLQNDAEGALEQYSLIPEGSLAAADNCRAAYGRGIALMACGKQDKARKWLEKACEEKTLRPAASFYLGVIDYDNGDFDQARRNFAICDISRRPGVAAGVYLAEIDFAQGQYGNAIATARRAASSTLLNTEERAALDRVLGESLWNTGNQVDAVSHLKANWQQASSPSTTAAYLLAVDAYRHSDNAAAKEYLKRALHGKGTEAQGALLLAGQIMLAEGKRDGAAMAFERAINASPSDDELRREAFYSYAVARFAGGTTPFGSAVETLENFLAEYPTGIYSDRIREYLAQGYLADEDYTKALERLQAIANPSQHVLESRQRLMLLLAERAMSEGKTRQAMVLLSPAAQLAPNSSLVPLISLQLGKAALATGDNRMAAEKLTAAVNHRKISADNKAVAQYLLAYALAGDGKHRQADSYFAAAENSGHFTDAAAADIAARRGDMSYATADFAAAANHYRHAIATSEVNADYSAYQLARMLGFQRRYPEQIAAIDSFIAGYPSSTYHAESLLDKAAAQIAASRTEDALATYQTLIESHPRTSQGRRAYLQKAMTLLECGRRDNAVQAYKDVISLYPTSEEASQASGLLREILAQQGRGTEYIAFMETVEGAPAVDRTSAASLTFGTASRLLTENSDTTSMASFLARFPDAPEAEEGTAMLAQARYDAGDTPGALSLWQSLEPKASTPQMALRARLGILRSATELDEIALAGAVAQTILESPASGSAMAQATYARGRFLAQDSTTIDDAIELWRSVADDTNDIYGCKSAFSAAEALFMRGDSDSALECATALSQSRSPHRYWVARAFILMADILAEGDNQQQAREYLLALKQNYPGDEVDISVMIDQRLEKYNTPR